MEIYIKYFCFINGSEVINCYKNQLDHDKLKNDFSNNIIEIVSMTSWNKAVTNAVVGICICGGCGFSFLTDLYG